MVLPLNLEGQVHDDDSVLLLGHELESLDYTLLYQAYSAKARNPAVDPKTMFKILTYAYSQNIYVLKKNDYNFQKFVLREKTKVKLKILLLCMGYNLNKLVKNQKESSNQKILSGFFNI